MTTEIQNLKNQADEYKFLYKTNQVSRNEAAEMIMPYIEAFNARSKEIAKKYNMKPKTTTFAAYIR